MDNVVAQLNAIEEYRQQFQRVFGTDATPEAIAQAITAFQRTVVSGDSDFDRYQAGDKDALSPEAQRGMELFNEKAQCSACHSGPNFTDEGFPNIGGGMDQPEPDLGRYAVTGNDVDKGKFKTPTLRDIAQTGPYMHDGSLTSLKEVVEYYNRRGTPNSTVDSAIRPLNLTEQEQADLVAFLKALTGRTSQTTAPELPE